MLWRLGWAGGGPCTWQLRTLKDVRVTRGRAGRGSCLCAPLNYDACYIRLAFRPPSFLVTSPSSLSSNSSAHFILLGCLPHDTILRYFLSLGYQHLKRDPLKSRRISSSKGEFLTEQEREASNIYSIPMLCQTRHTL